MTTKKYQVTITEFTGEGEGLKAARLFEQTVDALDIKGVILAVNADAPFYIEPISAPRKRAPRSDKGKARIRPPQTEPA